MQDKFDMFRNRLEKVYRHLSKTAKRQGVTCYRLYDHDLPEFPLCVELYEDKLYVAEYKRRHNLTDEEHDNWLSKALLVLSEILSVPEERIFLKLRQRKPGRLGQYQRLEQARNEWVVEENGLKFLVNLSDYLDTGLFLDHRLTRMRVRELSEGKKVLNLFSYTGSFSVYAAAGGATQVDTVDMSRTYLSWAQRNLALNGFTDENRYRFIPADVKQYLREPSDTLYDIIVLDPPTFSNSKRMEDILDIQRDHVVLINQCLDRLHPGGHLFFSTNFRKFVLDTEHINATSFRDITKATTPFDFEGRLFRWCYYFTR
ncbi:class I SAM-dependent methyltransferase [Terrimonas ferruginea]|uniref:class I SAM-dependent methyltransferase n=1 Tax=Terrimonas ferruginea TaxID=249 RepID=UPI00092A51BD|nr:class I SAM-dependent methyltransferase [Terrimonas ferruginea]OJW43870.1 MAG: SAM-dependent methyltransferase [Sphingobacteriales bacterium 48-107]